MLFFFSQFAFADVADTVTSVCNEAIVLDGGFCHLIYGFDATSGIPVTFPQFDSQLGSLQSVQLTAFGSFKSYLSLTPTFPEIGQSAYGTFHSDFFGSLSNGDVFFSAAAGVIQECISGVCFPTFDTRNPPPPSEVFFDFETFPLPEAVSFVSQFGAALNPATTQDYIGTGTLTLTGVDRGYVDQGDNIYPPSTVPGSYTVSVDYSYFPNAVPEPSFILVTGAAFGLLLTKRLWRP